MTNQWPTQPARNMSDWDPRPPANSPSPSKPPRSGLIVILVLFMTIVSLVILAVVVYLPRLHSRDDDGRMTLSFTASATVPPGPETTVDRDHDREPRVFSSDGSHPPYELDRAGWTIAPDARCHRSDNWVYAARNADAFIVVCSTGPNGPLYYRASAAEGPLEITDNITTGGDVATGRYTVPYPPSRIDIDGKVLTIWNSGGSMWGEERFDQFWYTRQD